MKFNNLNINSSIEEILYIIGYDVDDNEYEFKIELLKFNNDAFPGINRNNFGCKAFYNGIEIPLYGKTCNSLQEMKIWVLNEFKHGVSVEHIIKDMK